MCHDVSRKVEKNIDRSNKNWRSCPNRSQVLDSCFGWIPRGLHHLLTVCQERSEAAGCSSADRTIRVSFASTTERRHGRRHVKGITMSISSPLQGRWPALSATARAWVRARPYTVAAFLLLAGLVGPFLLKKQSEWDNVYL